MSFLPRTLKAIYDRVSNLAAGHSALQQGLTVVTGSNVEAQWGQTIHATAAIEVTLPDPAAVSAGAYVTVFAIGGDVTLVRNGSETINGEAEDSEVSEGVELRIYSDGTNYKHPASSSAGGGGGGGMIDLTLPFDANVFGDGSDGELGTGSLSLSADMEYTNLRNWGTIETDGYRIQCTGKLEWGPSGLFRNDATSQTGAPGGTYCGAGQDGADASAGSNVGIFTDGMGGAGGYNNTTISSNRLGGYPGGVPLSQLTALSQLVDGKFGTTLLKGGCGGGNYSGNYGGGGGGVVNIAARHILLSSQRSYDGGNTLPPSQGSIFPSVDVRGNFPSGAGGGSGIVILVAEYIHGHQLVLQEHDATSYSFGGPATFIVAARNAKTFVEHHKLFMAVGNYKQNGTYGVGLRTRLPNYITIQLV